MPGVRAILSTTKVQPDYFGGRNFPRSFSNNQQQTARSGFPPGPEPIKVTARPPWVPEGVWRNFLSAGEGVHRFRQASQYRTDIVLARRNQTVTGYAEAPSDYQDACRLLASVPASRLGQLIGRDNVQSTARWAAGAAPAFNRYMFQSVRLGMDTVQARQDFDDAGYRRFAETFTPRIGISSSPTFQTWFV